MNIAEIRQRYPQYSDLSDDELLRGLHAKHYSDMDYADFSAKAGYQPESQPNPQGNALIGAAETAATFLSGAIAEPVAGIAGMLAATNPFADEGAGARTVEGVRDALTYAPQTEKGREYLGAVGDAVAPLGEALSEGERALGDKAFEITGSPTIAALATSVPTAIIEVLGLKGHRVLRSAKDAKEVSKMLQKAAPTSERLRKASTEIFTEIDEMGVRVKPDAFASLASRISREATKRGMDSDITPAAAKAVRRFSERIGDDVPLSELDTLREVAQGAASSINAKEKMLGSMIIEQVDDFLGTVGEEALTRAPDGVNIGRRYRVARKLWGQARKGELLEDAVKAAGLQASGFENGIRTQFRQILRNKKQRKFFNAEELREMEKVVRGTTGANAAKFLGKFGISENQATNLVGTAISGGSGAAIGSAIAGSGGAAFGALALPAIGQIAKMTAQRITKNNARFATRLARAGSDGREIVRAYLDNTPKRSRNITELSELLAMPDIALDLIGGDDFVKQSVQVAKDRRALFAAASAGTAHQGVVKAAQEEVLEAK